MNHKNLLVLFILVAALAIGGIGVAAQSGSEPSVPQGDGSMMGTSFTYQGQLKDETGSPLNATCDFRFTLWDADDLDGTQIGGESLALGVAVSQGYFTALVNDSEVFGYDAFTGEPRWLGVGVRCPAGSGPYTALSPRQPLTAVPFASLALYAPWSGLTGIPAGFADDVDNDTTYSAGSGLALAGNQFSVAFGGNGVAATAARSDHIHSNYWRTNGNYQTDPATNFIGTADNAALVFRVNNLPALRLEPNATSPNVIGGYSGNSVSADVYGATIGGGGASSYINRAQASYAVVGGGKGNTANGDSAVVGGGNANNASQNSATVGGGTLNQANGGFATVGGGNQNMAVNYAAVIAGGEANRVDGNSGAVGGGSQNHAYGDSTVISGGEDNYAQGDFATISGGTQNTAAGYASTIPGGLGADTSLHGQMSYASGYFATPGDAQTSLYMVRNTSYNASWTNLYLDGVDDWLFVPNGSTFTFDIFVTGRTTSGGRSAGYRIQGVIENFNTVLAFVGTPVVTVLGEDSATWDVQVVAGDTQDVLGVQVKGGFVGEEIRWVASIQTVAVAIP